MNTTHNTTYNTTDTIIDTTTHTDDSDTGLVLVTGGTGKTGRRVADRLHAAQVPTRIGSRSAPRPFDWHDRASWDTALDGVRAVYVAFSPDLALPGADELIAEFTATAVRHGAARFVLLSGRGEEGAESAERALQAIAPSWSIVRCSWFDQNFSEDFFLDGVRAGTLAVPAGDVAEPFIDVDDIADVAVAALLGTIEAGSVLELTGPELLTFDDVAAELSAATGRSVEYLPVSNGEFRDLARAHGMPGELADGLGDLMAEVLDGRNASTTNTVARVLGRPARSFRAYAHRTAATGVWEAAERVEVGS